MFPTLSVSKKNDALGKACKMLYSLQATAANCVQLMYHGLPGMFWSTSGKEQAHCLRTSELPQALVFNFSFGFNEIGCQMKVFL